MSDSLPPAHKPITSFGRWLLRAQADLPDRVTWKQLAVTSGLSYSYLIQLKNGHERPTANAIARLEAALGIPYPGEMALAAAPHVVHGMVLVPILQGVLEPPWLVSTGLMEPMPESQVPGPDGFFVIQGDAGLMPSIPPGALCLTDPHQRHATADPRPMLLRLAGGLPVGRLVWRSPRGMHVVAGQGVSWDRRDRETPVSDGRNLEVLGRLVAVRYSLR